MEQFVKQLGIPRKGYYDDNKYVVELTDSNDFSRIYSLLEESDIIELDENILMTEFLTNIIYVGEKFRLQLVGNYEKDIYKIIVEDLKEIG